MSPTIRATQGMRAAIAVYAAAHGIPRSLLVVAMLESWLALPGFARANYATEARDCSGPWVNVTRVMPDVGVAYEVAANAADVPVRNFARALVRAWDVTPKAQRVALTTKRPKPGTIMARVLARLATSTDALTELAVHLFGYGDFAATRRTSVHLDKMSKRGLVSHDHGRWILTERGRWLAERLARDAASTPKRPKGRTQKPREAGQR